MGCTSHGNDYGFYLKSRAIAVNCVADGNLTVGIYKSASTGYSGGMIIGCRITNQNQAGTDSGIDLNGDPGILGWNYFEDNGDSADDNVVNDTLAQLIYEPGTTTDTNEYSQGDTNEGYVDKTNHDFSTGYTSGTDPHLRRKAITLPWT